MLLSLVCAVFIGGCSTSAAPYYMNGNYYMVGDVSCINARTLSPTRIMCVDKDGNNTGYRDAMTSEQIQMYQIQRAQRQMEINQLSYQLGQMGNQFNQMGQQSLQQIQQYTPAQVTPISPNHRRNIRCISAGIYTNCFAN